MFIWWSLVSCCSWEQSLVFESWTQIPGLLRNYATLSKGLDLSEPAFSHFEEVGEWGVAQSEYQLPNIDTKIK